jgi:putative lipoic acid-binding regulatory protein
MDHLKLVPNPAQPLEDPVAGTEDRYARLREVLSRETFPLKCTHKLIGVNSAAFEAGLQLFESEIVGLNRTQVRSSGGNAHLSVTYEFTAESVESMLSMLDASAKVPDLKYML